MKFLQHIVRLCVVFMLIASKITCWKCDVNERVCEIWLEIRHHLTMMKGKSLVVLKNGSLFPYNAANFTESNEISKQEVITADGWAEPRVVIGVNGTMPGPIIEVHEGQIVRLHVRNMLRSEATSLHVHGQHQRGTPWMDGVSFVTQCPVLPGQSFTYQFKAQPTGTYWYHAHTGAQSPMGFHGPFLVHPKQGASTRYQGQLTVMVEDWNHDWDTTMGYLKMEYGMFAHGIKESNSKNLAGSFYSLFRCQSVLINGRGRYRDPVTQQHNDAPLETFSVKQGNVYLLRITHAGSVFPVRLSVDGHRLKVVATDGKDLDSPVIADSVILTPGERYDVELDASHSHVGNYWITAKTLEVGKNHIGEAILHYEGAAKGSDPQTQRNKCTSSVPCVVVNCPWKFFPQEAHTKCVNVDQLRATESMPYEVGWGAKVREHFLNFAFPGIHSTPASVNGIAMTLPKVSALTQPLNFTSRCPGDGYRCGEDDQCSCTGVLDLAENDVIQLVFSNLGNGKGWDHPIHMHGHHFWVMKIGYPQYNHTTGVNIGDNTDIDCGGNEDRTKSFCNRARWANSSWSGNSVPGLVFHHPVLKDTVNVPSGGYAVVRIKADNPGLWSLHCHVSLHMEDGMFLLLNESYPTHPPPPPHFPACWNFDVAYPVLASSGSSSSTSTSYGVVALFVLVTISLGLFLNVGVLYRGEKFIERNIIHIYLLKV